MISNQYINKVREVAITSITPVCPKNLELLVPESGSIDSVPKERSIFSISISPIRMIQVRRRIELMGFRQRTVLLEQRVWILRDSRMRFTKCGLEIAHGVRGCIDQKEDENTSNSLIRDWYSEDDRNSESGIPETTSFLYD